MEMKQNEGVQPELHVRSAQRSRNKQPSANQKRTKRAQDVVYLPPKPFNRNRLVLRLLTVIAVVIALLLGVSVFFKVDKEKIMISGNDKYSAWDIQEASGLRGGENLLSFNKAGVAGKIIRSLPYVEEVRFGIKLPNTVMIEIVEIEVTYAVKDQSGAWWLISSGGKVVEKAAGGAEATHTQLLGVQINAPQVAQQATAKELEQTELDPDGNPIPVVVTQAQKLQTGLEILQHLEANGIIGKAASVDVSDMGNLELWYGQQYQVTLGDSNQLSYKISCMKATIDKMDSYQSGVLDVSFTLLKDKVGYTPFKAEE